MKKVFSIIAAILFTGSMFAADATIAKGTTNSYDDVTINGAGAIKTGKSSAGGDMTVTVGASATSLKIHMAAWKGEGNQKVTITAPDGVTITPAEATLTANDVFTGSGKAFTVTNEDDYLFSFALTGVGASGAKFTITSPKRAMYWGATYDTGAAPTVAAPTFQPTVGTFEDLVEVTLACATEGATIYYTLDGTTPDETSLTINPFSINETTTVKAIAIKGEDKSDVVEKTYTKLVVKQYEVAEAIAAGLSKGDLIEVRGVITKIDLKPSNFAKYGSVNIYVKDATGATGEFEFYGCYSLNADTFKTTTPEVDPSSTAWTSVTSITDKNGQTVTVGDTVIAKGKYELYNETYELQQNCFLTSVIPGEGPQPQTIDINIDSEVILQTGSIESNFYWQVTGQNDDYYVSLTYLGATEKIAGTYTEEDLDADYTAIYDADDNEITMVSANITVTVNADETVDFKGTYVGNDGNTYNLNIHYAEPKPETTVTVVIDDAEIDLSEEDQIGVMGEDATGLWVQLFIYTDELTGNYTEEDLGAYSSVWFNDYDYTDIFSADIEITPANLDNGYLVKAELLCYNNTLYKVTMTVPGETTGINKVNDVKSLIKTIENGNLFINVNGVRYNVNGAVVK